ncbi:MAG: glycosyltransferase family 39 protein [Lentisphaeria bacterium]|nr:glycosyltransferase family 39 protein [Lentisphaeria bacterium]
MFYANAMVYGPLHYAILALTAPDGGRELTEKDPEYVSLSGKRIIAFRAVAAVMSILIALLLYFIARICAGFPDFWSFAAALAFQLLPGTLYYSHTSNMDLPYLFWLTLAVLAAGLACRAEKKSNRTGFSGWNLAAGALLACSFCTKDQVYAVCVLPALVYAVLRFRSAGGRTGIRRLLYALMPHLLWGVSFLFCTILIYGVTVGPDGAAAHWKFISGEGKDDFFPAEYTSWSQLKLIFESLASLGEVLDPAGLVLLAAAALGWGMTLTSAGGGKDLLRRDGTLWLYALAALISQQILFYQVVRRCEFRYNLPLAAAVLLVIFSGIRAALERKPKPVKLILLLAFFLQGATAYQFLFNLKSSPLSRLAAEMKESPELKICCLSAARGHSYYVTPGGEYFRIAVIRSWIGPNYGLLPREQLAEAENDLFSCFWLDAKIILLPADADLSPAFRQVFSEQEEALYFLRKPLFSFCPVGPKELRLLPRRKDFPAVREAQNQGLFADFAEKSAEDQLLTLTFLLQEKNIISRDTLIALGYILKPFSPAVMKKATGIAPEALQVALAAYESANRHEEAEAIRKFLETHVPALEKPEKEQTGQDA